MRRGSSNYRTAYGSIAVADCSWPTAKMTACRYLIRIWGDSCGDIYVVQPGVWGRVRRVVKFEHV